MDVRQRLGAALAGHYRIERLLGEGGMAVVFLAEDLKHHRPVALKVLRPEISAALGTDRFLREIEVVAGLNHPNILSLHDSGEADGLLYFVMPYVEGESLRARLDRETRLPLDEALRISLEVGEALHYAHEHGLVHRDIKPENILFQAGHALVCDFGIAQVASEAQTRLTRTGVAVGTFTYMSPEQLSESGAVDRRTDLYALGCLLHEMLTGEVPFPGATPQAALARKLMGAAPDLTRLRPDVPPTLSAVLDRALAVEPEDRHSTTEEFLSSLASATTRDAVERDARQRRRRRTLRFSLGALGVGAVVGAGWWLSLLLTAPTLSLIAVLPLANSRNDTTQAYLAQGIHEELVLEMARAGIGVLAPGSAARFAGTSLSVPEIASALGVQGLLQGSVGVGPGQISLDLRLVDGVSQQILWVESFRESPGNLIRLYHEVTRSLAERIGVQLSREALARLTQGQAVDPQVEDALLQARFEYQKLTEAGLSTALDYYRLVLERDPRSARAWVGIAKVWTGRVQMGYVPPEEGRRAASEALARARALDPDLPGAQAELAGTYVWTDWNWPAAEEAFRDALAENPVDAQARASYAHLLLYLNRDEEALEQAQRAVQLDPFNTITQAFYGMTLNFLRRYEEAEAALLPVLAREPRSGIILTTLRTTYHLLGRHEEAMEMWRTYYQSDPELLRALEKGYQAEGYSAALRAVAELMEVRARQTYTRPWLIGTVYLRAGMGEASLPWLEAAFAEHDNNMPYISVDPIFDPVRDHPRFQALMEGLKLPR